MTSTDAPFARDLGVLLARDLETFAREVELMPDDASLWTAPPGVTNPCGTLALHCAGNLQHYVGAVLGSTGYVRDREREFSKRTGSRAELAAELRRGRDVVATVLGNLAPEALDGAFPELVGGVTVRTRIFLLHLAAHLGFHLGQADYLRRLLTGDGTTARTMPVQDLVDA